MANPNSTFTFCDTTFEFCRVPKNRDNLSCDSHVDCEQDYTCNNKLCVYTKSYSTTAGVTCKTDEQCNSSGSSSNFTSCDTVLGFCRVPTDTFVYGKTPDGRKKCKSPPDCSQGFDCVIDKSSKEEVNGICEPYMALDAPCTQDNQCTHAGYSVCDIRFSKKCRAPSSNNPCSNDWDCEIGTVCQKDASTNSGTCSIQALTCSAKSPGPEYACDKGITPSIWRVKTSDTTTPCTQVSECMAGQYCGNPATDQSGGVNKFCLPVPK